MEDQKVINQVRESLALYDRHWDEWLYSEVCFLEPTETKAIGALLAFQSIEESARLLAVSQDAYLNILGLTLGKLRDQHFRYITWLVKMDAMPN